MQRCVVKRREHLPQARLERAIQLHHVNVGSVVRQPLGEDALAPSDLEHDLIGVESCGALDHVEDVAVDEEVLAELHHPNTAAAARSTSSSSCS